MLLGWLWALCISLDQTLCVFTDLRALIKAISGCYAASLAWFCLPVSLSSCAQTGFLKTRYLGGVPCTHLALLKTKTQLPALGWGRFFIPLVSVGKEVQEAEAPISICSVVGSRIRGFAEQPEPLHPSERAESELALHNPADKTVLGSHIITTRIPTSQPTCV